MSRMTVEPDALPRPVGRIAIVCVSAALIAVALVWAFFSMRAVMDVGGACADGGPYVSAQPCPDGTWLIAVAVPLMLIAAFAGTMAGDSLEAPDLLLPMWFLLFAFLGANFLEYGFWSDPWEWGFIVCGVVFELMAFPALYFMLPIAGTSMWTPTEKRRRNKVPPRSNARWWWTYLGCGAIGATIGYLVWDALK